MAPSKQSEPGTHGVKADLDLPAAQALLWLQARGEHRKTWLVPANSIQRLSFSVLIKKRNRHDSQGHTSQLESQIQVQGRGSIKPLILTLTLTLIASCIMT